MANILNFKTGVRLSADGKWIQCTACSKAYWGAFRPTDFVSGKLAAHVAKAHKAEAGDAPADAADLLPKAKAVVVPQVPALPGMAPLGAAPKPARKPAQGKRAAAKAAARGDGPVRIVREAGPSTAELLGDDLANLMAEVNVDVAPRLQGAQGPRNYTDHEGDRDRRENGGNRNLRLEVERSQRAAAAAFDKLSATGKLRAAGVWA